MRFQFATFQTHAAPLRLRLGWEDLQAIVRHAELSPWIVMRTGSDGKSRVKSKLAGITNTGIAIETAGYRRSVHRDATLFGSRDEVRQVQLMPVKGDRFKGHRFDWRKTAAVALVPVGIGLYILGIGTPGGIPEGPILGIRNTLQGLPLGASAPNAIYRLAWRADRRNGVIFVEPDHGR